METFKVNGEVYVDPETNEVTLVLDQAGPLIKAVVAAGNLTIQSFRGWGLVVERARANMGEQGEFHSWEDPKKWPQAIP